MSNKTNIRSVLFKIKRTFVQYGKVDKIVEILAIIVLELIFAVVCYNIGWSDGWESAEDFHSKNMERINSEKY